jgi:hypothetical protein
MIVVSDLPAMAATEGGGDATVMPAMVKPSNENAQRTQPERPAPRQTGASHEQPKTQRNDDCFQR